MNPKCLLLFAFSLCVFTACQNGANPDADTLAAQAGEVNPPAEGFNAAASDAQALEIADEVMEAMGGRQNWDNTRYISWNFFGRRKLVWDKQTGDVRIDIPADDLHILLNVNKDGEGQVMKGGEAMTNPDSLQKYLEMGKGIWINDSYWLVMPYKLKDSGVTLTYMGEDTTKQGAMADVLQLTFEGVGRTPQNKYHVYVDKGEKLVTQWDYFPNAQDSLPQFSTPWADYQQYGNIMLSGSRGERGLSEIAVYDTLPPTVFTSLTPVAPQ